MPMERVQVQGLFLDIVQVFTPYPFTILTP